MMPIAVEKFNVNIVNFKSLPWWCVLNKPRELLTLNASLLVFNSKFSTLSISSILFK